MSRRFGPKPPESVDGRECPACHEAFAAGEYTCLVTLGPGADEDARLRRDQNRPYNAVALEVHWDCASAEARND